MSSYQPQRKPLRLIDADIPEPSRQMVALARVEQQHREYRSSNADVSNPQGWHPIDISASKVLDTDKALLRSYKVVVVDGPLPWYRKLLRKLKGTQ